MKRLSNSINILLALCVIILTLALLRQDTNSAKELDAEQISLNTIMTRSSVRHYSSQKISEQKIETLLRAAMCSPSAGNSQPWQFYVVSDTTIIQQFGTVSKSMTPMNSMAKTAIIVCGDNDKNFASIPYYWVQDCSAASQNILLAAHSMGLGAVWCGVYPRSERVSVVKSLIEMPDNITPLNIIMLGYPDAEIVVKDKWKPELVHYVKN